MDRHPSMVVVKRTAYKFADSERSYDHTSLESGVRSWLSWIEATPPIHQATLMFDDVVLTWTGSDRSVMATVPFGRIFPLRYQTSPGRSILIERRMMKTGVTVTMVDDVTGNAVWSVGR